MTALPAATPHKVFSLARVSAIASNTLLELVRLKVFYFLLLFALLIIGSSAFTANFSFQEQFQVLKDVSLGAMSIFTWLLAVLATAMLLPKDIEDRTLYTILAKPVPRFEYLLGKFLGVLFLLFIALSLMSAVFAVVLSTREQSAASEIKGGYRPGIEGLMEQLRRASAPGPDLDAALREVRSKVADVEMEEALKKVPHANSPDPALKTALEEMLKVNSNLTNDLHALRVSVWNVNLVPGVIVIYLKAALCAALTLLLSTFATSSIFTIIVSVVVYLIGHIQPLAREAYLESATVAPLTKIFLALVSLLIPDLTALSLVDDIVVGNAVPLLLFARTAALGGIYVSFYFLVGYFVFAGKEL